MSLVVLSFASNTIADLWTAPICGSEMLFQLQARNSDSLLHVAHSRDLKRQFCWAKSNKPKWRTYCEGSWLRAISLLFANSPAFNFLLYQRRKLVKSVQFAGLENVADYTSNLICESLAMWSVLGWWKLCSSAGSWCGSSVHEHLWCVAKKVVPSPPQKKLDMWKTVWWTRSPECHCTVYMLLVDCVK